MFLREVVVVSWFVIVFGRTHVGCGLFEVDFVRLWEPERVSRTTARQSLHLDPFERGFGTFGAEG